MKLEFKEITVREIFEGYANDNEEGVLGYGGKLNIRPKYQREFIYKPKQRDAVMKTIKNNFPLNVMYWAKTNDGTYELMDGQQRTLSFCMYVNGDFSLDYQFFHNLTETEKEEIMGYKTMIYLCEGNDKEKLDWFRTINIAGEKLTDQELRNAVYAGAWTIDAKRHFSKTNCPAYNMAKEYMKGTPIRQDYLDTALEWIAGRDHIEIEEYMAENQLGESANELWVYYQNVINWVKTIFPEYRREMKGVEWGLFYNEHKDKEYNTEELERKIKALMMDDEVTCKKGIYGYLLEGHERHLSLRKFTESTKREAYERQGGVCAGCNGPFEIEKMEGDHIVSWSKGGKTIAANCQMLCLNCNREKSDR